MVPKRYSLFGVPLGQWLAVLPMIAIVGAVLYPVFQKVREHNPRFSCNSNMQQLGLALMQYTQDYDEETPPGINALNNGWAGQIYPYIKATRVYHCPDDMPADEHISYISYSENQRTAGQSLAKFADPASTVELYETTTLNCDPSTHETVSATGLTAPQNSTRHDSPQNPFGLNFLLADGHVKMLTPGQVSSGQNAAPPKHKGAYAATFAIQ